MAYRLVSRLPFIVGKADQEVQDIIERYLYDIEREAKDRSRWKTGNMRSGWMAEMTGKHEGMVYNLVEYTIYNEYGTVHMSAQPMLTPAVEALEPFLLSDIAEVYS